MRWVHRVASGSSPPPPLLAAEALLAADAHPAAAARDCRAHRLAALMPGAARQPGTKALPYLMMLAGPDCMCPLAASDRRCCTPTWRPWAALKPCPTSSCLPLPTPAAGRETGCVAGAGAPAAANELSCVLRRCCSCWFAAPLSGAGSSLAHPTCAPRLSLPTAQLINSRRHGVAAGRKLVNTAGFWSAALALMLMPGEGSCEGGWLSAACHAAHRCTSNRCATHPPPSPACCRQARAPWAAGWWPPAWRWAAPASRAAASRSTTWTLLPSTPAWSCERGL